MNLLELNMVSAFDIDLKFQFNPSGATCLHSTVANIKIQENLKVYFTSNNHTLYKRSTVELPSSKNCKQVARSPEIHVVVEKNRKVNLS